MFAKIVIGFIDLYRRFISPLTSPSCRFYPSCSSYTRQAVVKYGALKGVLMGVWRIMRCHPFHPGGYDPV
ncbi:membrane protein insertion efficiency factor YidD [Desulfuromonas sp. TF]|uniref:membrane protein insertion efficiency factor YidD n=1 Tax=Desulfuromonas sp. TF TaxID=1232410 RepID=UPI0003F798C3|nr:membrane protein insertion efficiency factor YidD [Desulfuromonas sp. TF]